MIKNPKISVLMPAFNAELYISDAIDSILGQTYSDFEFIIINDGSTDKTEDIILSYDDHRIKYFNNEQNLGLIETLNKGLKLCKGEFIARMDADDVSLLERLEVQLKFINENSDVGLLGTWYESFSELGSKVSRYPARHDDICLKQFFKIQLCHGTCLIRKSILVENQFLFDKQYAHAEDYELFTRIARKTKLANLQKVLYRVRKHENEVSNLFSEIQINNTNLIKIREFKTFGYQASSQEIADYTNLLERNYSEIKLSPLQLMRFLKQLIKANNTSKVFAEGYLTGEFSFYFYHYCYNTKNFIALITFIFSPFFIRHLKNLIRNDKISFFFIIYCFL